MLDQKPARVGTRRRPAVHRDGAPDGTPTVQTVPLRRTGGCSRVPVPGARRPRVLAWLLLLGTLSTPGLPP